MFHSSKPVNPSFYASSRITSSQNDEPLHSQQPSLCRVFIMFFWPILIFSFVDHRSELQPYSTKSTNSCNRTNHTIPLSSGDIVMSTIRDRPLDKLAHFYYPLFSVISWLLCLTYLHVSLAASLTTQPSNTVFIPMILTSQTFSRFFSPTCNQSVMLISFITAKSLFVYVNKTRHSLINIKMTTSTSVMGLPGIYISPGFCSLLFRSSFLACHIPKQLPNANPRKCARPSHNIVIREYDNHAWQQP